MATNSFTRDESIGKLRSQKHWDMLVIGGGATGASIALDAATRGLSVALIERDDFGKGTSSRSTNLVHGGVRYLAQGNISLVREALHERTRLRNNAPHVVHELSFLVPCANRLQQIWYSLGFFVYDWLAGKSGFTRAKRFNAAECLASVPTIAKEQAKYGILYSDGQFDDTRLLLNILQSASERGATVCNYVRATDFIKNTQGKITGVIATDVESASDTAFPIQATCVINATGAFCDELRSKDSRSNKPMIAPSQGVHIVLSKSFLPGNCAVIVPKTSDGRVIFMIPWHDHTVVGTTDTPIDRPVDEPDARREEIDFLLKTSGEYLSKKPTNADILSVFTGIRPLVRSGAVGNTSKLSRDHTIEIASSGLVTITGGKWTTARSMAEDCVNRVQNHFPNAGACATKNLALHGSDRDRIDDLLAQDPALAQQLVPQYPIRDVDVVFAARHEMARSVEDVLARRTRLLFLNARAASLAAPRVAQLLANELKKDDRWVAEQLQLFNETASHFLPPSN
jgi:glycerol-3-phosphate dehydrogenase